MPLAAAVQSRAQRRVWSQGQELYPGARTQSHHGLSKMTRLLGSMGPLSQHAAVVMSNSKDEVPLHQILEKLTTQALPLLHMFRSFLHSLCLL